MVIRRIATPSDLGAAVRDARTGAQLTQAQLAEMAGVSREWLIGLERGARPRAELTKVLDVLAALDLPLGVQRGQDAASLDVPDRSPHGERGMSTAEVTQKAIERAKGAPSAVDQLRSDVDSALRGSVWQSLGEHMNRTASATIASTLQGPDLSSLMPQMSPALSIAVREHLQALRLSPGFQKAPADPEPGAEEGAAASADDGPDGGVPQ